MACFLPVTAVLGNLKWELSIAPAPAVPLNPHHGDELSYYLHFTDRKTEAPRLKVSSNTQLDKGRAGIPTQGCVTSGRGCVLVAPRRAPAPLQADSRARQAALATWPYTPFGPGRSEDSGSGCGQLRSQESPHQGRGAALAEMTACCLVGTSGRSLIGS